MTTPRTRRAAVLLASALLAGGLLAACGDDGETTAETGDGGVTTTEATDGSAVEAAIEVTGAWARSSPMVASAGAAYMVITNNGDGDDAVLSASVPDTVAAAVELHETRAAGAGEMGDVETTMGEMDGEGSTTTPMMEMVPVDRIEVPAGESVSLEPGGLHVMMLELVEPLEAGDELSITLTFEVAGEIVVTAIVGDGPPDA